jgi:hypothetical protein
MERCSTGNSTTSDRGWSSRDSRVGKETARLLVENCLRYIVLRTRLPGTTRSRRRRLSTMKGSLPPCRISANGTKGHFLFKICGQPHCNLIQPMTPHSKPVIAVQKLPSSSRCTGMPCPRPATWMPTPKRAVSTTTTACTRQTRQNHSPNSRTPSNQAKTTSNWGYRINRRSSPQRSQLTSCCCGS